jgi:hypothetical protein
MNILPSEPYHGVSASAMHMKLLFRGSGEEKPCATTEKEARRRCNLPKPFSIPERTSFFYRLVYFRRIRADFQFKVAKLLLVISAVLDLEAVNDYQA